MSNTIEAAEMLEKEIERLERSIEKQQEVINFLSNRGDDVTLLETNQTLLRGIVERNKSTAQYIRETAI